MASSADEQPSLVRYPPILLIFSTLFTDIHSAGLSAGVTEAVAVVTPMEVIKIRLQAQHHSMADPLDVPKYRNAAHALYTVVREEGFGALYRGVSLTALRQGSNQAGESDVSQRVDQTRYQMQIEANDVRYSEFHCLHILPTLAPRVARNHRPTIVPNHVHWSRLRCHGTPFECTD